MKTMISNKWLSAGSLKQVGAGVCVLLLTASGWAADRHVPTTTYPTIAAAVAAAQSGDRIIVDSGTYHENVVSGVADLEFVGHSAVWDGTLTNGTPGVCLVASGGGIVLRGFRFRAGQEEVAQVQLTGDNCRVRSCSSRGPNARFLLISGNSAVVDSCSLFSVNSTAIEINGDDAVVRRVRSRQGDDDVVLVTGHRATVTRCTFLVTEDDYSIRVTGSNAIVSLNRFIDCDDAIRVIGDNAVVERNSTSHTGTIDITGDNLRIRRNTMRGAPNDNSGLIVHSRTGTGGGIVERNIVRDTTQQGLNVGCHNATVRNNRVTGAGTEEDEHACNVTGNFNLLSNNSVTRGGTHAFNISGLSNSFVRCFANDAAADGFHIAGAGNSLDRCTARRCTGEGLDNGGAGTVVTRSIFRRNRIDVANDGSFAEFTNNSFSRGGTNQPPQID
jgi:hypothetical protein